MPSDDCGCAYRTAEEQKLGRRSIAFTNEVVTPQTRSYLRALPRHLALNLGNDRAPYRVLFVHGSPRKINEYLFEDRPDKSFLRLTEEASADALVFGHTHRPFWKRLEAAADGITRYRHAVNAGSVGKPKDGDARACWVLVEIAHTPAASHADSFRADFRRVPYDVERAARAVEESALPDEFARALRAAT